MGHSNEQCCAETNAKTYGGNVRRIREILGWSDNMNYSIVEITPQMASDLLVFNSNNRKITYSIVDKYCNSILTGQFALSNDAITFDSNGVISNGQHRLMAVVKADMPLTSLVMLGVEQSPEMDRGVKRNIIDNIILLGEIDDDLKNYTVVKSCKALFDHLKYRKSYNCVELDDFINKYSDEIRLAYTHKLINIQGNIKRLFSANVSAAFLAALITYSKKYAEDEEAFNDCLNKLMHIREVLTTSIATTEADNVIIHLRDKLTTGMVGKGSVVGDLVFKGVQYTIHYYMKGGHNRSHIRCTNNYFMDIFKEDTDFEDKSEETEAEAVEEAELEAEAV